MERTEIILMPSAYVGAAAAVLLLPLKLLLAALAAAACHEFFHLLMLKYWKIPVYRIKIGSFGASIETGVMTPGQELWCSAAGPLGSFSLLLWIRWFPLISLLGAAQGLFNLLPIYPLDGGRVLRSIFILAKNRH